MNRKVLWFLVLVVIWVAIRTITVLHNQCMSKCVAEFKGAYPEIACKYECSFFDQFKKPLKRP